MIASNDNWTSKRLDVVATTLPPTIEREAAILITLDPGSYTAVLHDISGLPGLGLVEVYDLEPEHSILRNSSTRGMVEAGDNIMIGGSIIGGESTQQVLVRVIGPSLSAAGIKHSLANPTLELHDANGYILAVNDDWRSKNDAEITATGLAPKDDREAAILANLYSGSYTAIVRGKDKTSGVTLVEV